MKKKIIGVVILVLIGVIAVIYMQTKEEPKDLEREYIERQIKVLTESYPTNIIVYGKDFMIYPELNYKKIDKLDKESLQSSSEYKYNFLVFNDMDDDLPITDEEIRLIKEYIYDKNYNFYYVGKQHEKRFVELGVFRSECMVETSRGQGVFEARGSKEGEEGFWQEGDREILNEDKTFLVEMLMSSFVNIAIPYNEGAY